MLAAACLWGCTTVQPPPLPATAPAAWANARAALASDVPAPDLANWWKAFGDRQLDALVEHALAQNLTLAQATAKLRQARMMAGRSHAQYLPELTASSRTLQDVSATDSYFHASLDASWELGLFGARESADLAGKAGVDAAVSAEQAARVTVIAEVVRNYVDLRTAQQQLTLLDRVRTADDNELQLIETRRRFQVGAPDERELAMARRAQSLAQAAQLRQNAAQTRQAMAVLLGQTTPDPALDAPAAPLALPSLRFAQLPADMVRSRPEIRAAEAEVARAAAELGMARADLYPRISLGASYLYAYNLTQNRRSTVDRLPVIGPAIDIPLFDWGRRRTTVDVKQDMLDTSLIAYRQAVVQGIGEAESALIALAGQEERVALAGNVVDALAQREAILRKRTALKLATEFDAAASGRAVLQAELERSAAEAARAQAFVALYKSLGGAPMPAGNDQLVGQRSPGEATR